MIIRKSPENLNNSLLTNCSKTLITNPNNEQKTKQLIQNPLMSKIKKSPYSWAPCSSKYLTSLITWSGTGGGVGRRLDDGWYPFSSATYERAILSPSGEVQAKSPFWLRWASSPVPAKTPVWCWTCPSLCCKAKSKPSSLTLSDLETTLISSWPAKAATIKQANTICEKKRFC